MSYFRKANYLTFKTCLQKYKFLHLYILTFNPMRKSIFTLIFSIILCSVNSCKDETIVDEGLNSSEGMTRSSMGSIDILSDEYRNMIQSDVENMLVDQIFYKDSTYILNLTRDEAAELNISDSIYSVYEELIQELNSK